MLAATQYGLFTRAQAHEHGVTDRMLQRHECAPECSSGSDPIACIRVEWRAARRGTSR